ncbi:MAG: leucine-rich repeat domain-containing protein [Clostridiales bacterium]|nr:leucine-rich repeat domain-containing protein [Clostridiales bacterium]
MRETPAPRQYPCPFCGGDDRTLTLCSPALPPRTVLDHRYVVGGTLGQGGFGITYRAYDLRMGNTVAVKEYFPSSLVGRDSTVSTTVTVNAIKGERALDEYASGLRHFLFEARRQARLASSPGVVSVTDFFEANNTAYYIMEYVDGSTLVKYMKRPLPLAQVLELLEPISDSLISIHEAGLIHRDISPDNIMCAKNGQRKLLDFGASHSFAEEESTTGNATLKHGFAPPEQYGSSNLQGPWADVYAFAATVYWCLTGKIPPDSMDRSIGGDKLKPPSALGAAVTPEAEAVLLRGMALPVTARYQDIPTFWNKLKKAAAGRSQLNIPVRPSPAFSDPDGKTMVVTPMEPPERTKVPVPVMERPGVPSGKQTTVEEPEHTVLPPAEQPLENPPTVFVSTSQQGSDLPPSSTEELPPRTGETPEPADEQEEPLPSRGTSTLKGHFRSCASPCASLPVISEPDITLYRPVERPVETGGASEEVPQEPEVSVITRPDRRLLALMIGVIAVLAVALVFAVAVLPRMASPGDISVVSGDTVTIAGTDYPLDTTELFLTGDSSYTSHYSPDGDVLEVSYLTKSDWNAICQLTNLKTLSVVGCGLTSLEGISALTELEVLDVSGNDLSSLSALAELDGLVELYAADNGISDLSPLSGLTDLTVLDLSDNNVSDPAPIQRLSHLTNLSLAGNQLTDISSLSSLTGLATLDLSGNRLESLSALYGLSELQALFVDGNPLTNSQLESFAVRLPACTLDVEVLDIPDTVTIGGKSYSTSLTKLDLSSASLGDGDIDDLKYMVNLTELDLSGNAISDFSALSRLYSLTSLTMSYNRAEDISCLSGLIHLKTLYLSSNNISDLSPIAGLTELETLAIGNNPFTSLDPVSGLTNLTLLVMCDCQIDSLKPLYTLTNLIELRISDNTYSSEELEALQSALPKCTINLF